MTTVPGGEIHGSTLHEGRASGPVLALTEPLSLWGGTDLTTGRITDRRHPQAGLSMAGRILAMPGSRGSSSSASVLAEQLRLGVGPAAVVLAHPDPVLVLGALVVAELYAVRMPIVLLGRPGFDQVVALRWATVIADGRSATIRPPDNTSPQVVRRRPRSR